MAGAKRLTGYCAAAANHPFHGPYHDREYGFPLRKDDALFERLALEINQAGLSWLTILKKRKNFGVAFHQFDLDRVAAYRKRERARLLRDAGIIRNRLKINAVIENARRILELRQTHGSFAGWLDAHQPAAQAGMGEAVQEDLLVYWWGDNRRVSFEHRLPARRSRARLSGLQTHRASKATVGAILVCTSDSLFIRLLKHSWGQASHHPDMSAIADARPWRDLTHRLSWKPSARAQSPDDEAREPGGGAPGS